jgi:hypothetical protein
MRLEPRMTKTRIASIAGALALLAGAAVGAGAGNRAAGAKREPLFSTHVRALSTTYRARRDSLPAAVWELPATRRFTGRRGVRHVYSTTTDAYFLMPAKDGGVCLLRLGRSTRFLEGAGGCGRRSTLGNRAITVVESTSAQRERVTAVVSDDVRRVDIADRALRVHRNLVTFTAPRSATAMDLLASGNRKSRVQLPSLRR